MHDVYRLEPGYNAAVLAHLLGTENVTSIEIDPVSATRARTVLLKAGYPIQVIIGDGEDGYPPNAPYDRIIATASAHTVPIAWIQQTRPGGTILLPWAPTFHPDWPLCRLRNPGRNRARPLHRSLTLHAATRSAHITEGHARSRTSVDRSGRARLHPIRRHRDL